MKFDQLVFLVTGFIFGFGFASLTELLSELYIYFYHKNKDYRERKQEKNKSAD